MKNNLIRFIKFSIVGFSNTIISYCIYSVLVYFNVNYIAANIIGYFVGIGNSFLWNSRWVFKDKQSDGNTLFKFLIVNLLVLGITTLILYWLVEINSANKYLAQAMATIVGIFVNFTLNKIWTFKEEPEYIKEGK